MLAVSYELQDDSRGRQTSRLPSWLVVLPVAWLVVLNQSGISDDSTQFSFPVAVGLTMGTVAAMYVLRNSVRGWWHILAIPIWFLLLMYVLVLWYWNVK